MDKFERRKRLIEYAYPIPDVTHPIPKDVEPVDPPDKFNPIPAIIVISYAFGFLMGVGFAAAFFAGL